MRACPARAARGRGRPAAPSPVLPRGRAVRSSRARYPSLFPATGLTHTHTVRQRGCSPGHRGRLGRVCRLSQAHKRGAASPRSAQRLAAGRGRRAQPCLLWSWRRRFRSAGRWLNPTHALPPAALTPRTALPPPPSCALATAARLRPGPRGASGPVRRPSPLPLRAVATPARVGLPRRAQRLRHRLLLPVPPGKPHHSADGARRGCAGVGTSHSCHLAPFPQQLPRWAGVPLYPWAGCVPLASTAGLALSPHLRAHLPLGLLGAASAVLLAVEGSPGVTFTGGATCSAHPHSRLRTRRSALSK